MSTLPAKKRRSQAERSAETQGRVLEAAIRCLHERGYAATTTLLVAEEAGLSRGAMLHHFPTKVELMLFVVREAYQEELRSYFQLISSISDEKARLSALPEVIWQVLTRPAGIGVLEIMIGSRSDPILAEKLRPLQREIEADSFAQATAYEAAFGRRIPPEYIRLVVWAVRGLSIAHMLSDDPTAAPSAIRLLARLLDQEPR